jgi:hypothetical protein
VLERVIGGGWVDILARLWMSLEGVMHEECRGTGGERKLEKAAERLHIELN